jgi:hypothetical protein
VIKRLGYFQRPSLYLSDLHPILFEKVRIVPGHLLGPMAGHEPELFIGDAPAD